MMIMRSNTSLLHRHRIYATIIDTARHRRKSKRNREAMWNNTGTARCYEIATKKKRIIVKVVRVRAGVGGGMVRWNICDLCRVGDY